MKEKLSPQEKKRLSYKKDHRIRTGEDDRAMRKAWAARKARVNRKYRRKTDAALRKATGPDRIDGLLAGDDPTTRELIRKGLTREKNKRWPAFSLRELLELNAERRSDSVGSRQRRKAEEARRIIEEIIALERDPGSPDAMRLLDRIQFGDSHLRGFYKEFPEWKKRLRARLAQLQRIRQKEIKAAELKAEQKWKWRSPALRKPRLVKPEDMTHP